MLYFFLKSNKTRCNHDVFLGEGYFDLFDVFKVTHLERQGRKREQESECICAALCSPVHSSIACNNWAWAALDLGVSSSTKSKSVTWVLGIELIPA